MKTLACTLYALALLLLFPVAISAQEQLNRIEIEAKNASSTKGIIPIGKEGVIVYHETNEKIKGAKGKLWVFTKYNTDFEEVWSKQFPVIKKVSFVSYDVSDEAIYFFLGADKVWLKSAGIRNNKGQGVVLTVGIRSGNIRSTGFDLPNGYVTNFKVESGKAYFSGFTVPSAMKSNAACYSGLCFPPLYCITIPFVIPKVFSSQPLLQQLNLSSGSMISLVDKMKGSSFVVGTSVNPYTGHLETLIRNEPNKKESKVILQSYNENELSGLIPVESEGEKKLNTASIKHLSPNHSLLIGTYSIAPSNGFGPTRITGRYNVKSKGIFVTNIRNRKQQEVKFYDFAELLSSDDIDEKESIQLLMHDLVETEEGFTLIAEAYRPTYYTTQTVSYVDGRRTTQTQTHFDGFLYTQALVIGFNKEGEVLWNHSFSIGNVKSFRLKEKVIVVPNGKELLLTYSTGHNIYTKVLSGNEISEEESSSKIETNEDAQEEKVKWAKGEVSYWYDNYFLSSGWQEIKNAEKERGDRKRRVFYLSKMEF